MEDPESKILMFRQPDAIERGVRLFCGALLGLLVGGYAWLRYSLPWSTGVAVTAVAAVSCAIGARKYGDDFWYRFFELWAWPWGRR